MIQETLTHHFPFNSDGVENNLKEKIHKTVKNNLFAYQWGVCTMYVLTLKPQIVSLLT